MAGQLVDHFQMNLAPRHVRILFGHEGLNTLLQDLCARAKSTWSTFVLADLDFVRHLAQRIHVERDVVQALREVHVEDLYLALGCAAGMPAALDAFEKMMLQKVEKTLRRLAPEDNGDELKQLLRQRLLLSEGDSPPRISMYAGRGPLHLWVRAAALRLAISGFSRTESECSHPG